MICLRATSVDCDGLSDQTAEKFELQRQIEFLTQKLNGKLAPGFNKLAAASGRSVEDQIQDSADRVFGSG